MFLTHLVNGLFAKDWRAWKAVNNAAGCMNPLTLRLLLFARPELKKVITADTLTWLNIFAGTYHHHSCGIPTLMVLHNSGVDVGRGLRLAVSYNADKPDMAETIRRIIDETGAVDQGTKNRAMVEAVKAGFPNNIAVLRAAGAREPTLSF